MIKSHEAKGQTARLALLLVPILLSTAFAVDGPTVYYSDGTIVPLIQSDCELVVEFSSPEQVGKSQASAMKAVGGVFSEVPWGNSDRFAILNVPADAKKMQLETARIQGIRSVHSVYRVTPDGVPVLDSGQLVVKVKSSLSEAECDALFSEYGVQIVRKMDLLNNVYVLRPVDSDASAVEIAGSMYADARTVYSQPDFRVPVRKCQEAGNDEPIEDVNPNDVLDEYFDLQWYLHNTGDDGGSEGADVNILEAWAYATGLDVNISFLDDACDLYHEDLGSNYLGYSHDASVTGEEGEVDTGFQAANPKQIGDRHGTCMAGLACASANSRGIRGVAPAAAFTFSRGLDDLLTNSQTASSFTFAEQQGVMIHCDGWNSAIPNVLPVSDVIADTILTVFNGARDELGMVVVFAAGNDSMKLVQNYDYATLRTVISVGATNARDRRCDYSNYCANMLGMAPTDSGNEAPSLPDVLTTDNTDLSGFIEPGYNNDGQDDAGDPAFSNPNYTYSQTVAEDAFGKTSASSAITAGVVALLLEVNPNLTATQVRLILEHTADKVSDNEADYHVVTQRSETYGYGRINAGAACRAAYDSLQTIYSETASFSGETWPDRVSNVEIIDDLITWDKNEDLRRANAVDHYGDEVASVMVVEFTNGWVEWSPVDGSTYREGDEVRAGVFVRANSDSEEYEYDESISTQYFGIYTINSIRHYSWGVAVSTDGEVLDPGIPIPGESGGDDDDDDFNPGTTTPKVSISASPLTGYPDSDGLFTVEFRGNAQTDSGIAETLWNFGDGSTDVRRTVEHTYSVGDGGVSFTAVFTVTDNDGDVGTRSITINVLSSTSNDNSSGQGTVRIVATDEMGEEISSGEAPLEVLLSLEVADLPGNVGNLFWDLGDGDTADALAVNHTYTSAGNYLVTVQVEIESGESTVIRTASKIITVTGSSNQNTNTNTNTNDNTNSNSSSGGTTTGACGVGMIMPLLGLVAFSLIRRRFH